MSGMAAEIEARMRADGASLDDGAVPPAAPVPGVVPGNAGDVPPPAGASNTDTAPPDSAGPAAVPYARFKEVNDELARLRPLGELESFGYGADSLRRLAAFEQAYNADPMGVWASMASNLDLPPEIMQAITTHVGAPAGQGQAQATAATLDGQAPELSADDRRRLEYVDRVMERDSTAEREAKLDAVITAWDDLDAQAGVQTSMRTKLTWISSAAGGSTFDTVEQLARAAWDARMQERDVDLGGVVRQPGQGPVPPALPGSTLNAGAAPPVDFGDNIKAASAAALADIKAGRL